MDEAWHTAESIIADHNLPDPGNAIVNDIMEAIREGERRGYEAAAGQAELMRKVLRHCRMFIVGRRGYCTNEADERALLEQEITVALKGDA